MNVNESEVKMNRLNVKYSTVNARFCRKPAMRCNWGQVLLIAACAVVAMHALSRTGQSQQPILDQYFAPSASGFAGGTQFFAQSFTVGSPGVLASVSLSYGNAAPHIVHYELRRLNEDGRPSIADADLLASGRVVSLTNRWMDMDFSAARIAVEPGDQFAVTAVSCCYNQLSFRAGIDANATYLGGEAFSHSSGSQEFSRYTRPVDFHFRTYLIPVPEPSGVLLAFCGFALIVTVGWKLRAAQAPRRM